MSDLSRSDVVTMFNTIIRNPMNSGITWGAENKPSYGPSDVARSDVDSWFTGSTSGNSSTVRTGQLGPNANAEQLRQEILARASLFTNIRRIDLRLRYNDNGNLNVFASSTAIAHLNTGYRTTLTNGGGSNLGRDRPTSKSALQAYMQSVYTTLNNRRESSVTLHRDYCHSSCHSNCHSSGRRRR